MRSQPGSSSRLLLSFALFLLAFFALTVNQLAQDTVTGAFEGTVRNRQTGAPIAGAIVQFINQLSEVPIAKRTDTQGRFYQGLLPPGTYTIRVTATGYQAYATEQRLLATRPNSVVPVPVELEPETAAAPQTPTPTVSPQPAATPSPQTTVQTSIEERGVVAEINTTDARRGGAFTEVEVSTLPLGAVTLTRTFDELALLLPGVALPPRTQGSVAGPGIGAGVGSAGQFAVNGLRSRANNFTVDGSDNNDEDIGVRRQGFLALVPQPIESIKEFQMITLLAPAQFGRNIGAQVNAISKSGGNGTHGAFYGFLNASQLNARDFYDTTAGGAASPLRVGSQSVLRCPTAIITSACSPVTVHNPAGGQDSFTLGQGGFVLGGPLKPNEMFYFISAEGHLLNATKEASFAVPTVAQRGLFGSGATGLTFTPFVDINEVFPVGSPNLFFPTSGMADAVFSFFPFPNNPAGVYGPNTFTQVLPASAQGRILSGKFDSNFMIGERQQSLTARYNFTQDWREIPVTGNAIFSTLRPRVRTQNFSTFLNSELSGPNSTRPVFNQVRLSYGRTRLNFEDVPDQTFLRPTGLNLINPEEERFLLNAPLLENFTLPPALGVPNTGPVIYRAIPGRTTEQLLGPIGQLSIAGFSPVGVDVFNFPQRRVNNTYQVADTLTMRAGGHSLAFGTDLRRTELNSNLPRNSRPLLTFNGAPQLTATPIFDEGGNVTGFGNFGLSNNFIQAVNLAATSASSGFYQVLSTTGAQINLRYYQLNFFGQDEWRIRPNLSLAYGLRYEYNTPPRELNRRIESTFNSSSLNLVPGLSRFLEGRSRIFDPDRNNFAPRVGFAYSPDLFGRDRLTVIRAGYGIFYDQILGAVVSQSRNVFPNYLTTNYAGGGFGSSFGPLGVLNPNVLFVQNNTLNTLRPALGSLSTVVNFIGLFTGRGAGTFGATLPARHLEMPMAHHYSVTFEQQVGLNMVLSAAYVGTLGRHLLRFTTPNLGPNEFILPLAIDAFSFEPNVIGFALTPGTRVLPEGRLVGGRPVRGVGSVNIFETTANSRYDALQLQARGRFADSLHYQVAYTFSEATDDVSDVFDLAGAPALPQNSLTFAGEHGPANFDARHRFSYNFIYDFPKFRQRTRAFRALLGGLQFASTGQFQTGQPFTVNSIYDVNLDGNLTDRLNTTSGIEVTGDRRQPLRLRTNNLISLLAPAGQDGSVGRNTFRAGNLLELDLSVIKNFAISEEKRVVFRVDVFNFINRANFGIPVRFLEFPGFGQAVDTITPGRRVQFALKFAF
ncbi:MAG TPA: carboxypeptidase regulatory-like domain-containing protein [Pyrinomonadaceae bacterium]|nr:carboxypeptidase regulatory-like domain-containing protein [Pyrinomonadaceae bacterium]